MDPSPNPAAACSTKGCACPLNKLALVALPILAVACLWVWWSGSGGPAPVDARKALEDNRAALAASMDKYAQPKPEPGSPNATPPDAKASDPAPSPPKP